MCMLRYEIIAFSYAYVEVSNTAPRSILRRTVPVLFVHALIPRYKHAKHDKFFSIQKHDNQFFVFKVDLFYQTIWPSVDYCIIGDPTKTAQEQHSQPDKHIWFE